MENLLLYNRLCFIKQKKVNLGQNIINNCYSLVLMKYFLVPSGCHILNVININNLKNSIIILIYNKINFLFLKK